MKPKTLILMFVAIGCGLAASYMTSRLLAERGNKEQVEEKIKILVAKKNLAMGTLIKDPEILFEEKLFTKGEEPKKGIRAYDQLKDRRLNKPLAAEQFVSADDLMDKSQDGLSALMSKGMRAFGVKVNAEATGGGFVLPNSKVDVVWVSRRDTESTSKIILQNVLVLAVDQANTRPDDKQAMVASTVTLAVTPDQAERLSLAVEMGALKLILRPFGDEEVVRTQGVNPRAIAKGNEANSDNNDEPAPRLPLSAGPKVADLPTPTEEPKAPEPPPAPPKTHTLTIYNGESVTKAVFVLDENNEPTDVQVQKSEPDREPARKPEPTPAPPPVAAPAPLPQPVAPPALSKRGKTL